MNQFEAEQPPPGERSESRLDGVHRDGLGYPPPATPQAGASQVFYASLGASMPCPTCGIAVLATAMGCPNCGTMYYSPRRKRVAVVLAVLLTFWTWYYTYRKDKWKFWVGLAVDVFALTLPHTGLGFVMLTCVWVWAIVDAAVKPAEWYRWYPNQ